MALVLVIDDEDAIRDIVRTVLEGDDHTVIEAANGVSGLWIFREMQPDLAIVDLFMPEKEGIETIRDIRAVNPTAKIIAMSGGGTYGLVSALNGVTDLGASSTLAKPFRAEQLRTAVEQQVTNSRAREARKTQ